mmetsp:Transcript_10728/g.21746  ORF Transcript_10728/g.21746 Transcript_10728/m.21746 type:complete len:231 (-) Transcript_10728:169-861(-)
MADGDGTRDTTLSNATATCDTHRASSQPSGSRTPCPTVFTGLLKLGPITGRHLSGLWPFSRGRAFGNRCWPLGLAATAATRLGLGLGLAARFGFGLATALGPALLERPQLLLLVVRVPRVVNIVKEVVAEVALLHRLHVEDRAARRTEPDEVAAHSLHLRLLPIDAHDAQRVARHHVAIKDLALQVEREGVLAVCSPRAAHGGARSLLLRVDAQPADGPRVSRKIECRVR